jgi:hypothetical protein
MMERVSDRQEKNGRTVFNRPKPTTGCRANGRRRRMENTYIKKEEGNKFFFTTLIYPNKY